MAFIRKLDYLKQIQSDDLDTVTESNDLLLDEVELLAIEEITSYISARYDVAQVFAVVDAWVSGASYTTDDVVYSAVNNKTYKAKTTHTGITTDPSADPTNWGVTLDPRNPKIVTCTVDLALYHLHSRINPRNIPELRGIRREDSINWLEGVRENKNNPTLPAKVDGDGNTVGVRFTFGSNTQNNQRY